jgi:hypothetical protein
MVNALYDKGRQAFLNKDIDMVDDNIKAVLVDTRTYTVDLAAHDMHNDLSGVIATSGNMASKTTTAGVFDAADLTFSSVTGATVEAVVIYRDSGTSSTSELIAYIDTGTGLPVTPNGGDITIAWDNGTNKIFKL